MTRAPTDVPSAHLRPVIARRNATRADIVISTLLAHHVEKFFVCPGSRSTPLIYALKRHGLTFETFHDERTAAFAALGSGRAGMVACVITTSGSAVANLLPALTEADVDCVPVVVLTADRPAFLVHRGANQTLDQIPLLQGAARASLDMRAAAEVKVHDDKTLERRLDLALAALNGAHAGAVHLNFRTSKPLEPPTDYVIYRRRQPLRAMKSRPDTNTVRKINAALKHANRPLVCVGGVPERARADVAAWLKATGVYGVVDITAGIALTPHLMQPRALLSLPKITDIEHCDAVIWIGSRMTEDDASAYVSKLEQSVPRVQIKFNDVIADPDALFAPNESHTISSASLRKIVVNVDKRTQRKFATFARRYREAIQMQAIEETLGFTQDDPISELAAVKSIVESTRRGILFIGNSMPIRDATRYASIASGVDLIVNRGVSGIDGNIATLLGAHLAQNRQATIVLGDVATLHDLSGLFAVAMRKRASVRIVVINNDGGGIFRFLPVSGTLDSKTLNDAFVTPHNARLAHIASSMGIEAHRVLTGAQLKALMKAPVRHPQLIEVFPRAKSVDEHRTLDRAIAFSIENDRDFDSSIMMKAKRKRGVRTQ